MRDAERFLNFDRESKLENEVGLSSTKYFLLNIVNSFLLGDKEEAISNLDLLIQIRGIKKNIFLL